MKRCPQCNSVYSDTDRFCELDGTLLVEADLLSADGEPPVQNILPTKGTTPIRPGQI